MRFAILLVILAVLTSAPAFGAEAEGSKPLPGTSTATKTQVVSIEGVKLDAPAGWIVDRSEKYGVPLVMKHPDFSVNGVNVTMIVMDAAEKLSVDDLKEKIYALAEKRELTVLENEARQVGLFSDGYYALMENSMGGDTIKHGVYFAQFDNKFLVLTCTARSDGYTENSAVFEQIAGSLRP